MRLHEQRDRLEKNTNDAVLKILWLRENINRKIAAPYGDGSRSNMVNAETDILPQIEEILSTLLNEK